ncbi:hypothetical protein J40TS1_37730 [Paenibacillus montaniterrae]|uniref:Lipocalin-like domain-containing protein n=1 Tax=Paenibacillus montaniterrae TaxID=429341 RepID=A0A919YVQ9_9BACL|nr:hypothetical protein [Paenibacillus montaniterrae]GIP18131.1 hypothetical protein J40TS1_37730 [Paenibacillus montaniterrae]
MPKFMTLMLLLMVTVFLTSCKQDNKAMLLGVWESDQVSQIVGSDEELGQYNYLEVTETNIHAKTFNYVSVEGGSSQRNFSEEEKNINYQWITEKQILLQDSLFEIELKKDQMVLKSKNIEIHYYKKR